MPPDLSTLHAEGERVWVRTVQAADVPAYQVAVERSRERLQRWNPTDAAELRAQLALQSRDRRTFVIHAHEVEGGHDIVGRVNVTGVQRGRFQSASMGYDAYDPYAGRGLFAEGLRLVVSLMLADESAEPPGMGLHRVEASVQPGNVRSAAVLRSLGFQQEGRSPRMLWLPDGSGSQQWREHLRFAITREQWPAVPYAAPDRRRTVVLVNGPSPCRRELALQIAVELGFPVLTLGEPDLSALGARAEPHGPWTVLRGAPTGAVLELHAGPRRSAAVESALAAAGLKGVPVSEVWCAGDPGSEVAESPGPRRRRLWARAARSAARPGSDPGPGVGSTLAGEPDAGQPGPLGLGPLHRVDLSAPLPRRDLVLLALELTAASL